MYARHSKVQYNKHCNKHAKHIDEEERKALKPGYGTAFAIHPPVRPEKIKECVDHAYKAKPTINCFTDTFIKNMTGTPSDYIPYGNQ